MSQPPVDPDDEPMGGSLTPRPADEPAESSDLPQPPAFPPPPPPGPGYSAPASGAPTPAPANDFLPPPPPPPTPGYPGYPVSGQYPPAPPSGFDSVPAYPPAFPPGPGYGAAMVQPHRGTTVLVLGILGLLVCSPLAFVAFFMGRNDLAAMDAGTMDPAGRGTTNVGRILGLVGMAILVVTLVAVLLSLGGLSGWGA